MSEKSISINNALLAILTISIGVLTGVLGYNGKRIADKVDRSNDAIIAVQVQQDVMSKRIDSLDSTVALMERRLGDAAPRTLFDSEIEKLKNRIQEIEIETGRALRLRQGSYTPGNG